MWSYIYSWSTYRICHLSIEYPLKNLWEKIVQTQYSMFNVQLHTRTHTADLLVSSLFLFYFHFFTSCQCRKIANSWFEVRTMHYSKSVKSPWESCLLRCMWARSIRNLENRISFCHLTGNRFEDGCIVKRRLNPSTSTILVPCVMWKIVDVY